MKKENQEPQFNRIYSSKEYDRSTLPIPTLLDKNLTGNALRLLQVIIYYGKKPKWTLRQAHLMQESCLGFEAYTNAIQKLITAGYVRRLRPYSPGKYSTYIYQYCAFPEFKDDKIGEDSNNVCDDVPDRVSQSAEANFEKPALTSCLDKRSVKETTTEEPTSSGCCSSEEDQKKHQLLSKFKFNNFALKSIKKYPFEQIEFAVQALEQNIKNGLEINSPTAYLLSLVKAGAKPNATKEDLIENLERERKKIEIETINRSAKAQRILVHCEGKFNDGYYFEVKGDMIFFKAKNAGFSPLSLRESDSINLILQFCKRNTLPGTF